MANIVSRIYSNFRGADFRGEEINLSRSPDCLNVWKDYKEIDSIRTRPGLRQETVLPDKVYGIFFYAGEMFVHAGSDIYIVKPAENPQCVTNGEINPAPSQAFVYGDLLYFKDGVNYLVFNNADNMKEFVPFVGYVPTTSIARKPEGGGTAHEGVNLLSDYRINTFLADGHSVDFFLDTQSIDRDFFPVVTVNDQKVAPENLDIRYEDGCVSFVQMVPEPPATDGQDNVSVKFKKTIPGYKESILKCALLQPFDNRVFFSGNPDHPNMIWHCALDDPFYCKDQDFYREGLDASEIRGMVAGNNALWVFRKPSAANTTVFYHTPAIDSEYGKIYPSSHSSVTLGCTGRAINFNDDIIFFSDRGMEGISGDITTEQIAAHRSTTVDRKLTAEESYNDMILDEWNGYLFVFIGNKVYLADSRSMFQNENHYEYDWYYWELDKEVTCSCVHDGVLYVGTADGVYSFTDYEKYIESYWVTPKDKFKNPHSLKTTNKRGSVGEATGDISIYAKTESTDFEYIGTYENVTDYFVSRIKRKKFKDIQLKFHSLTRFSLETFTLEAFIGGYIKR